MLCASGEVNPHRLNNAIIGKTQNKHTESFSSVEFAYFHDAFKRAASEWILSEDLKSSRKKTSKNTHNSAGGSDDGGIGVSSGHADKVRVAV